MAAHQQTLNLNSAAIESDEQTCEHMLEQDRLNYENNSVDSANAAVVTKRKMKIALIGPAIDRLTGHVRWGNRLSSSFYRTVGLNVSLRTVTTKTPTAEVDLDFVVWQLSPSLSPSLLKSFMRGASALIVAVGQTVEQTDDSSTDKLKAKDSETPDNKMKSEAQPESVDDSFDDKEIYLDDKSSLIWATIEDNVIDIDVLDKSANYLKLPIAFIHFGENSYKEFEQANLSIETPTNTSDDSSSNCSIVKLHETDYSLHLGLDSEEDSETCLCQAFEYIAEHFVYSA